MALVAMALMLAVPRVSRRYIFGDSIAYMKWPKDFVSEGIRVMGARPPVYPLLLDLLGTDSTLVYAQTLLSFVAWSWLGWLVGRLPGVALGIAFALLPFVWRWNVCILSESTSLSMMALCLALSFRLARRAAAGERLSWPSLAGFALAVCMFAWLRDANLLVIPALLLPACYGAVGQRCAVILILTLALGVGWMDSRANGRTQWGLDGAILERVLTDPEATRQFTAAGMPISGALMQAAGSARLSTRGPLRASHPEFFAWTAQHGARVYWAWVLSNASSYRSAWRAADAYHAADLQAYPPRVRFPALVDAARWLAPWGRASWTLVLMALLVGAAVVRRHVSVETAMAGLLFATALLTLFVTYHADAMEVHRHMLSGLVLQRAAFFIAAAALVRLLWHHFERRRHAAAAVAES